MGGPISLARSEAVQRPAMIWQNITRYAPPMKAAVHTRYGPSEVVAISEVEMPTLNDGELLVKVYTSTVNRTDAAYRAA